MHATDADVAVAAVVGDMMGVDGRLNMEREGNSSLTEEGDPMAVVELVTESVSGCCCSGGC